MEEDPKDHDFDQRHDGPLQRPSIQIATDMPRRTRSDEQGALQKQDSSKSAPNMGNTSSPISAPARRSTQITRGTEDARRKSTQTSRNRRSSRDFDIRRDGPYGRPSLTMTRRKSSGLDNVPMVPISPAVASPERPPAPADDGKAEEGPTDQTPPSIETLQSTTGIAFEPEPPPLNYSLWKRKWSILIFWSLILIDSIAMPIVLYICLWDFVPSLSPNTVFSIVTAALGGISIFEYFARFWRLWKKGSTCRVIGARRMYLDWFHWNFTVAWVIIMVELIVGSIPNEPLIRLLAMPLATMCYVFGTELLIVDILHYFQVPAPCRISSIPKGAQLRPAIYSIIEDICAVDGSGGTEFRENFNKRYEASHVFRAMLRRLGAYWAVGAEATAVLTTILIFTVHTGKSHPNADNPRGRIGYNPMGAYCIGWSLPFVWAGIWTAGTYLYVMKKLREEKKSWAEELAAKTNA